MIDIQKKYHSLGISAVNKYGKNLSLKELDFGPKPDILKEDYLDV